jgi:nitrogen fixation protein FixH
MMRTFTGRHMAAILVTFFGVVIAVNFTMAYLASASFGGLVVENSYVASQKFNGWLEQAREEKALGWSAQVSRTADHHVMVLLDGAARPRGDARLTALVRHPLGMAPERTLRFAALDEDRYQSLEILPAGRWIVHIHVAAHGGQINRVADLP